ncbi:MAG TPA: hypothetical protein VH482_13085 [Thermomicrobiales bacterium]|jgi:hypothetical protein
MRIPPEQLDHFEAHLTLLPTDQGGRANPIRTGYMPNWWLPHDDGRELASAGLELIGVEELSPGATGDVRIYPFAPELWRDIPAGTALEMTEGPSRTIGIATVSRFVPALTPAR